MTDGFVARGWKGKLKLVVFSLIPALLMLGCAEVFAGLTITRRAWRTPAAEGGAVYHMRMGRLPWSRESRTPLNPQGFPDRDFATLEPKGACFHVVVAGDSYAFGDGVDLDSAFVSVVRRRAAARFPDRCIRFFNLGERGTTIDRQAATVDSTFTTLEPDLVLLVQYQNDLTDLEKPGGLADTMRAEGTAGRRAAQVEDRLRVFNANLVRLLSYHGFALMIRRGIRYDVLAHWSALAQGDTTARARRLMEIYEGAYARFIASLRARDVPVAAVIIPSKFDLLADRFPEEPYFVGLAERHEVPFLRVYDVLDAHRAPYPFLMYDGHLNETGNRLVADAIVRWLWDDEPAPVGRLRATGR